MLPLGWNATAALATHGEKMKPHHRRLWLAFAFVAFVGVSPLRAQYAPAPDAYTLTETSAMAGPGETMKVYRDGQKAAIDITPAAGAAAGAIPVRSVYDLQAHTNVSWDPTATAPTCGSGTFSGDWGDPFAGTADTAGQLAQQGAKKVGAEPMDGFATDVYEFVEPTTHQTYRVWVDTKYGLTVKLQSGNQIFQEITQLSLGAPPAALFVLPAACSNLPPILSDSQKIAADTGGNGDDYVYAHLAPTQESTTSCTVVFRAVQAGTMKPIQINYAVGLDLDQNSNGGYNVDVGLAGTAKFSGGALKDVSAQKRNGVLRIPNVPKHFYMDVEFGDAGSASALLYRQCFGPETTLFLVVKNPDKFSDGADWLWSKTGK
jgi:hypothetical protein